MTTIRIVENHITVSGVLNFGHLQIVNSLLDREIEFQSPPSYLFCKWVYEPFQLHSSNTHYYEVAG